MDFEVGKIYTQKDDKDAETIFECVELGCDKEGKIVFQADVYMDENTFDYIDYRGAKVYSLGKTEHISNYFDFDLICIGEMDKEYELNQNQEIVEKKPSYQELEAERDRYKQALEEIKDRLSCIHPHKLEFNIDCNNCSYTYRCGIYIAIKALEAVDEF